MRSETARVKEAQFELVTLKILKSKVEVETMWSSWDKATFSIGTKAGDFFCFCFCFRLSAE